MYGEEVERIKLILSDVNPSGSVMLSSTPCYTTDSGGMTLEDWIGKLYREYERFYTTELMKAFTRLHLRYPDRYMCPTLPGIYDTLRILHCQLQESPTLVFTVKVAMCTDETLQATTSTMSGNIICQETLHMSSCLRDHVTSVLQQLALPFRVANDYNLYTHEEFVAYYGEERAEASWGWAKDLYTSRSVFVCENGKALREWQALSDLLR